MSEQLWRRCPKASETTRLNGRKAWHCRCHGFDHFVPVAAGALLIEDGEAVAVERMLGFALMFAGLGDTKYADTHLVEQTRAKMARLLRAACGEGDR